MTYIEMIASYTGRKIQIGEREATIHGPDAKVALLTDETGKVPYLRVVSDDNESLSIHPAQANRLMTVGSIGAMKLIGDLIHIPVANNSTSDKISPAPIRGQKKTAAIGIFTQDRETGSSRKQTIQRFVAELGMSEAGASTYYQNCKHWVSP